MQPRFVGQSRVRNGTLVIVQYFLLWLKLYDYRQAMPSSRPAFDNIYRQCRLTPAPLHQEMGLVPSCD